MVRINNGVYQVLKIEVPYIIIVECVCHSIQQPPSAVTTGCVPRLYHQWNLQLVFAIVNMPVLLPWNFQNSKCWWRITENFSCFWYKMIFHRTCIAKNNWSMEGT